MIKLRKYALHVGVAALAVAGLGVFSGIALADDPGDVDSIGTDVVRQTPQDTPNPDNAILAEETGLSIEEIDRAMAAQKEFGEYAEGLLDQYPGQISAIWMDNSPGTEGPNTQGNVRFKGATPTGIETKSNVVLTGGGLISLSEHKLRAELAATALLSQGYTNFATYYDPREDVIRIDLLLPEGTIQPSKLALMPAVRQQLVTEPGLQGRSGQLKAEDLKLVFSIGDGPFLTLHHSRGGNWLRDGSIRECNSAWSVDGPDGPGIITAAHCSGLDKFEQPGVTPYGMTFRDEAFGDEGDVEYHTTSHAELAEFYATASHIRIVDDIQPTDSMVGKNVCFYGRASNVRTCNIEVLNNNATLTWTDGTTLRKMAVTDSTPSVELDSGAGWSYGFRAWGVNTGRGPKGQGVFTPVEQAQDALNVTIRTQ